MDWQEQFKHLFFDSWKKAGLPEHQAWISTYVELREHQPINNSLITSLSDGIPGITFYQLKSVYGFGRTIGMIFCELLGMEVSDMEGAIDWCGRFNLGISLYDFICDIEGNLSQVTSLKSFEFLHHKKDSSNGFLSPSLKTLNILAESVLSDLKKLPSTSLMSQIKEMYHAENLLSEIWWSDDIDPLRIERALYFKSAAPFKLMAEYIAHNSKISDPILIENARQLGNTLGYCYWYADDARDVWDDLEKEEWNLFILQAIFSGQDDFPLHVTNEDKNDIEKILLASDYTQTVIQQLMEQLVNVNQQLKTSLAIKDRAWGIVAASLWNWLNY